MQNATGDPLGYRAVFGVVTPSVNTIVQPEYDAMRPAGVTNQVARIHVPEKPIIDDAGFSDLVFAIDNALDDAVERVLTCQPTCVIMGVSIEAVYGGGVKAARAIERRLIEKFGEFKLIHAADALPAALLAYGIESGPISLVTPYMPVTDAHLRSFIEEIGYEYQEAIHLEAPSPIGIAQLPPSQIRAAMSSLAANKPRAIIQFGANMCAGTIAAEAEQWLRVPVISVNTATYWFALRRYGINDSVEGFGRLLTDF